ncbi:MAG TPA: hypothetical protein DDW85_02210 [Porphyromonadaceae bacterium]|nr:hypothetical protein [Porphyromonadaceae bacterium]
MKRVFLLFVILSLFSACSSDQQKAEKLIHEYLEENLRDLDSYQNIEMGNLQKISWSDLFIIEDIKKTKNKEQLAIDFDKRLSEFRENIIAKGTNPDSIIAYSIEHEYRAKNLFGGYIKNHVEYWFDAKIENIIDVIEK